ncbi:hypothetical protein AAC387_Pa03g4149 [Persea americana]
MGLVASLKGHLYVRSLFKYEREEAFNYLHLSTVVEEKEREMAIQLENLVESIKSKVRFLKKSKKPYVKMDKSKSVRVEIRSKQARKLIDKTLKAADRPGKTTLS